MSKLAEEKALSEYPSLVPKGYDEFFRPEYEQNLRRCGFIRGYDLARKENIGLTWEDIKNLDHLLNAVDFENSKAMETGKDIPFDGDSGFYEEVLRRFNEQRNK